MQEERFARRLAQLRMEKGVSARDMSLSLGQSESYINKIENRKSLPSMSGFFFICDYLEISPRDFFDFETPAPSLLGELDEELKKISPQKLAHLLAFLK